jgi:hypothetical protein
MRNSLGLNYKSAALNQLSYQKHYDKGATYAVAPQLHGTPQPVSLASRIARPTKITPTE